MEEPTEDYGNILTLLLIGGAIILALIFSDKTPQVQQYPATYYYETHETNIDICGVCINTRP